MPVFYQHTINAFTRLGIWQIEENESFFSEYVPLQRQISHPHKRLQHLAGRYLLQYLFPGFPYDLIKIADTRKPFLSNETYHFSISHCGKYAAALVSMSQRVGVDIEIVKPAVEVIKHKFLADKELSLLDDFQQENKPEATGPLSEPSHELLLTICWSCKEAVYKWFGEGGVDFKGHIPLQSIVMLPGGRLKSTFLFSKESPVNLTVISDVFGELVLSVVVS